MSFKFSDCDFAHPRAESFFLLDLDQDRPPALLFGERALGIVGCVVKRGSQSVGWISCAIDSHIRKILATVFRRCVAHAAWLTSTSCDLQLRATQCRPLDSMLLLGVGSLAWQSEASRTMRS